MFYMMSKDFDRVMNEFPHNYNEVLDKSLERMDAVMRSNASCEVRMLELGLGLGRAIALALDQGLVRVRVQVS